MLVILPQETLEYFANPDNLNSDVLPPGLASWDPAPYLASAIPIAVSVVGVNFVHELGHHIAAFIRKVKLGPTYFVPNLQVSTCIWYLTGCWGTVRLAACGPVCCLTWWYELNLCFTNTWAQLLQAVRQGPARVGRAVVRLCSVSSCITPLILTICTCVCLLLWSLQIGSFGGVTPFQSLLKNRSDLWDVAAAGPIAGITASAALLAIGLSQSQQGGLPAVSVAPDALDSRTWALQGAWHGICTDSVKFL